MLRLRKAKVIVDNSSWPMLSKGAHSKYLAYWFIEKRRVAVIKIFILSILRQDP